MEDNNSLVFLDVYVKRTVNSKLWTTIYQKPTHTDRYLQFDSHHPLHHKLAVARTLYHRIDSHNQKPSERKSHFDLTKKTLTLNGFPARFSNPFSKSKTDKPASTQLTFSGFTTLPYIKGVSDKIKRILLETGVQVAFKPFLTTGRFLPSLKDEINHNEKSNLVYEVPCQNCPFVYIGQTKRDLKSRIKEHQRAIKSNGQKNQHFASIPWKMITSSIGLKSKFKKWNMITRSVFSLKVGTSTKSPKYSIEMMGYHSLLFTESCLIPSVEFLLV